MTETQAAPGRPRAPGSSGPPPGQPGAPLASPWLARAFHEIQRGRHVVLYGNIDDRVRWHNEHIGCLDAVIDFLRVAGFLAIARFDLVDGLTYPDPDSERSFRVQLDDGGQPARDEAASGAAGPDGSRAAAVPPGPTGLPDHAGQAAPYESDRSAARRAQLATSAATLQQRIAAAGVAEVRTPTDFFAAARRVLTQREVASAIVVTSADLVLGGGMPVSEDYRAQLAYLRRLMNDAAEVEGAVGPLRNTLVLFTRELSGLPEWIHRGNARCAAVQVEMPGAGERAAFLAEHMGRFFEADRLAPAESEHAVATLTNLTDGMSVLELEALSATSRASRIPVSSPKRLVMRHRFGLRDDPWERLDLDKVRNAEELLSQRVMGQPAAIHAVANTLVNARIGWLDFVTDAEQASTRPKGVFFFVGPTGVGKTELAKSIAELVFEDEFALRRFDMSEFAQEHTSERLTGAPPGYVGHEHGGVLTNWMFERPFSVVLFDEIEKAHPKIFDKFLQIIDDGRLTDGQGRTAYFSHSVVVFTSNLGAEQMRDLVAQHPTSAPPGYALIQQHFQESVNSYLSHSLGRPELLGRLGGGIVVFDILREQVIGDIVDKFLEQLARAARGRGYSIAFDRPAIRSEVAKRIMEEGAGLGARQIRSPLLEEWVRIPLSRWFLQHAPVPGARVMVRRGEKSPPFEVVEVPVAPAGS